MIIDIVYLLEELFCNTQNRFYYTTKDTCNDCEIMNCNSIDMEII